MCGNSGCHHSLCHTAQGRGSNRAAGCRCGLPQQPLQPQAGLASWPAWACSEVIHTASNIETVRFSATFLPQTALGPTTVLIDPSPECRPLPRTQLPDLLSTCFRVSTAGGLRRQSAHCPFEATPSMPALPGRYRCYGTGRAAELGTKGLQAQRGGSGELARPAQTRPLPHRCAALAFTAEHVCPLQG